MGKQEAWSQGGAVRVPLISPGALKDPTEHLKGGGKNASKDRRAAVPEHLGGDFHSIVHKTAFCSTSTEKRHEPKTNSVAARSRGSA